MTEDERLALSTFASEMSAAFAKLAVSFGGDVPAIAESEPSFSPASMDMDWNERVLRQSLILHEIVQKGGKVPHAEWIEIAQRYGYRGRGLAGFFRKGGAGLLELRVQPAGSENKMVLITKRGRDRLKQNQGRVDRTLAEFSTDLVEASGRGGVLAVPFVAS